MQKTISPELSHKLANMGFVCACMVVLIHAPAPTAEGTLAWWCGYLLHSGVCSMAVPFFFVAAGFFLAGHIHETGWWSREMAKRVRSLIVPYILWALLYAVYGATLAFVANILEGAPWSRNMPLSCDVWLNVFGLDIFVSQSPRHVPLWFLRSLMVIMVFSPLLVWVIRKGRIWGAALIVGLFCFYGYSRAAWWPLGFMNTPWAAGALWSSLSPMGLFYFGLGIYLRQWPITIRLPYLATWALVGGALIGYTGTAMASLYCQELFSVASRLGSRFLWTVICLWGIWRLMPSIPWSRALTGASLPIYLSHGLFLPLLSIAVPVLPSLLSPSISFVAYLLWSAVTVVLCIAGTWLVRHGLPRAAAVFFGGR